MNEFHILNTLHVYYILVQAVLALLKTITL